MSRILVIEDDEVMREVLRLQLGQAGYDVLLAKDAMVAAHAVMTQRPDLVLADIDLPYMNGLQIVEAMKSDPETARIPVIFVTGRPDAEAEAMRLGGAGYLTKPLRMDDLLSMVATHLSPTG
jgi:DNA-binding response OmpR family regulator